MKKAKMLQTQPQKQTIAAGVAAQDPVDETNRRVCTGKSFNQPLKPTVRIFLDGASAQLVENFNRLLEEKKLRVKIMRKFGEKVNIFVGDRKSVDSADIVKSTEYYTSLARGIQVKDIAFLNDMLDYGVGNYQQNIININNNNDDINITAWYM